MKTMNRVLFVFMVLGLVIACKPKGEATSAGEAGEVSTEAGTTYAVDVANSQILWEGTKVTGSHNGTVQLQSGELVMKDGELVGGNFTIDMNTITDLDLEDDWKANLENHLKGTSEDQQDDFFNVPAYPTAKFEITKATKLMNNEDANYVVNGNLTIKDTTKEIGFRALVEEENGMVTVSTPQFLIDRTEWGIQYRSSKFFDDLADKAINDEFGLKVELAAK